MKNLTTPKAIFLCDTNTVGEVNGAF